MRRFRKAAALGLAALMAVGSVNFAGVTTGAAGLPTTDGHDKYVNKNVFDVRSVMRLIARFLMPHFLLSLSSKCIMACILLVPRSWLIC